MDLDLWLAQRYGRAVRARSPVGGGSIHRAWRVELAGGELLFVKTNGAAALSQLEAEAEGLGALAAAAPPGLTIPPVLGLGLAGDAAVLVLPWLPLDQGGPAAVGWRGLGVALARLHRASLDQPCVAGDRGDGRMGWPSDNWIGATPQINGWLADWGLFFRDHRLVPQLEALARAGQRLAGADALLERVPDWLGHHRPAACLVHGDLWSGNLGVLSPGQGTIFDPAVYRGDREVDLAMARLFGGCPEAFFLGYNEAWPLPEGHERRRCIYDLYHVLNHANQFGGSYGVQAERLIQRLLGR
ncbi:MAG: fructosamine kinase family protein [Cyanobacteriota bacterium]|nr:fructosamine kinase family protein [Cyanobacteriota bacterium]